MQLNRRDLIAAGIASAASGLLQGYGSAEAAPVKMPLPAYPQVDDASAASLARRGHPGLPYPLVADTSAASPELVAFFTSYFTQKSLHNVDRTMAHFSRDLVTYTDATLGWETLGFDAMRAVFAQFMPTWPASGLSYPTRILGDMKSALVAFTDTPELFGGELRIIGTIDFKDGRYWRLVDFWDGRGWANSFNLPKLPLDVYREEAVGENASLVMRGVTSRLSGAMAAGNAAMAASLFTSDAVFEDMTLRAEIQGREAIQRYLARAISQLPYGMASRHRHTVGSDKGGGYEWWGAPSSPGKTGVTALVLDSSGFISRATSVYDGALFSAAQLQTLAVLSLEP